MNANQHTSCDAPSQAVIAQPPAITEAQRKAIIARLVTFKGKPRVYTGEHEHRYRQISRPDETHKQFYDPETLDVTDKKAVKIARMFARKDGNKLALLAIKNKVDRERQRSKAAAKAKPPLTAEEKLAKQREQARRRKQKQRAKTAPAKTEAEEQAELTAILTTMDLEQRPCRA